MKAKIGWVGAGRMGYNMASRLLDNDCEVWIYNRTRSKAEPLMEKGAVVVDSPSDLAERDIVFTMVSGPEDLKQVTFGESGVFSRNDANPSLLIDCSSVNEEASAFVRERCLEKGARMLAAPVSGNAKVVKAGKLSIVASGPKDAYALAEPYLDMIGRGASYVGEGELARMVKICHNILLGVYSQCLAEITTLAEKGGVPRHSFLDFINKSVMGCMFSKYKSPSIVNLDWAPTFTPPLLKKDLALGLEAGRKFGVPQPLTAATHEIVMTLIGNGYTESDFMTLLELQAKAAGMDLKPENVEVDDGLSD